jgi:hypothetical protein
MSRNDCEGIVQQDDEFPGVKFRIDGNSLFVEFDVSIPAADQEAITNALAAKLFDNSEVKVTVLPQRKPGRS